MHIDINIVYIDEYLFILLIFNDTVLIADGSYCDICFIILFNIYFSICV